MRTRLAAVVLLICFCSLPAAVASQYFYKVTLVQAAPGKLLELIDLYKTRAAAYQAAGDEAPLWMRHSQGDHWDLLILYPIGNYSEYYQPERIAKRAQADRSAKLDQKFQQDIA